MHALSLILALLSLVLSTAFFCMMLAPDEVRARKDGHIPVRSRLGGLSAVFFALWLVSCLVAKNPPWISSTFTFFVLVLLHLVSSRLVSPPAGDERPRASTAERGRSIDRIDVDAWCGRFDDLMAAGKFVQARASLEYMRARAAAATVTTEKHREYLRRMNGIFAEAGMWLDEVGQPASAQETDAALSRALNDADRALLEDSVRRGIGRLAPVSSAPEKSGKGRPVPTR